MQQLGLWTARCTSTCERRSGQHSGGGGGGAHAKPLPLSLAVKRRSSRRRRRGQPQCALGAAARAVSESAAAAFVRVPERPAAPRRELVAPRPGKARHRHRRRGHRAVRASERRRDGVLYLTLHCAWFKKIEIHEKSRKCIRLDKEPLGQILVLVEIVFSLFSFVVSLFHLYLPCFFVQIIELLH